MIQNCAILYFFMVQKCKILSATLPAHPLHRRKSKGGDGSIENRRVDWPGAGGSTTETGGEKKGCSRNGYNRFCRSLPGPVTVDHAARRSARSCRKEWPNAAAKTGGACRTGCAKPCAPGPGIPGAGVGEEQEAGRSWGHPGSDQPPAGAAGGVQAGRKFSSPRPPGNRATRSPAGRIRREAGPGPGCRPGHRCASVCRR